MQPLSSSPSLATSPPHLCPHALYSPPNFPMAILRRLNPTFNVNLRLHRRRLTTAAAAAAAAAAASPQEATPWTQAPLSSVQPAAESLFHVSVDVSDSPDLATSHSRPGQYLQIRLSGVSKPSFLAIASSPSLSHASGVFEFLVKSVAGSTAELLCGLQKGNVVQLSPVMGGGFDIDRISPPEDYESVLIFATGSGIAPIRSLIETGFNADKRDDVRLYYGARNLQMMAYQDRFKDWKSSGVEIVPVLSRPDGFWKGECGYVQAAFSRANQIYRPSSAGAVLCGQKQMTEELTSVLVAGGVSADRILKNF